MGEPVPTFVRLLPLSGPPESVALTAGHDVAGAPACVLDLDGRTWANAWVKISFSVPGAGAFSGLAVRALCTGPAGGRVRLPLPAFAEGRGRFAWMGRLPTNLAGLEIAAMGLRTPPALADVTLAEMGRARLAVRALARDPWLATRGLYWRAVGYRVRGRGYLDRALRARESTDYRRVVRFDALTDADRARIRAEVGSWCEGGNDAPRISIVMPVHDPAPPVLQAALDSVRGQLYPHWELCIADDASTDPAVRQALDALIATEPRARLVRRAENGHIARASNDALALVTGAFVALMDHDDVLPEDALYEVARALVAEPELDLIYSDEDKLDAKGRRFDPHFKPDWNRELLYTQNYINHLTVLRTELVRAVGGFRPGFEGSQDHDLLLRLVDRLAPERVRHIPRVLYHWRTATGSGTFSDRALARAEKARLQALDDLIASRGAGDRAARGPFGFNRLVRALPDPAPLVSVVIPTRDRAELLEVALRGLLRETTYPAIEAIIVDNGSVEPATRTLFDAYATDPRVRVLPAPGAFNFSALSNAGAEAARGTILLFLNNDVEVVDPDWLTELASVAADPTVGAVGAKLLYPDGTVQHGGVILGAGGVAGHSHLGIPGDSPGYFARAAIAQELSAVTGACLAMRKSVFAEVGGFDAAHLAVAFNDVDLCLRVGAAGYRVVWTPHAVLIHHESKSRGAEDTAEKRARFERETQVMVERWGTKLARDPYYNPNLSLESAHFQLW